MISSDPSTASRSPIPLAHAVGHIGHLRRGRGRWLWIRPGSALPDPTDQAAAAANANADPQAIPPEVKFASEQIVQSLGIELVPVASLSVSGTIAA